MSKRFPIFIDLSGKQIVVYGGGTIAARRVAVLTQFARKITVIAPEICAEIQNLAGVTCMHMPFDVNRMPQADLVLAATNDAAVNHTIFLVCRQRGIFVNNASDQAQCDFHFPAIATKGALVVGVNAGGADHTLVKRVAAAIRRLLEGEL